MTWSIPIIYISNLNTTYIILVYEINDYTVCKYIVLLSCLTLDTTLRGYSSRTFSFSLWATSSIITAEQQTVVYLFSPLKQNVDTNSPSHSHALRLDEIPEPLHWNSLLPSTYSHFFSLFSVFVCVDYWPVCPAPTCWHRSHSHMRDINAKSSISCTHFPAVIPGL